LFRKTRVRPAVRSTSSTFSVSWPRIVRYSKSLANAAASSGSRGLTDRAPAAARRSGSKPAISRCAASALAPRSWGVSRPVKAAASASAARSAPSRARKARSVSPIAARPAWRARASSSRKPRARLAASMMRPGSSDTRPAGRPRRSRRLRMSSASLRRVPGGRASSRRCQAWPSKDTGGSGGRAPAARMGRRRKVVARPSPSDMKRRRLGPSHRQRPGLRPQARSWPGVRARSSGDWVSSSRRSSPPSRVMGAGVVARSPAGAVRLPRTSTEWPVARLAVETDRLPLTRVTSGMMARGSPGAKVRSESQVPSRYGMRPDRPLCGSRPRRLSGARRPRKVRQRAADSGVSGRKTSGRKRQREAPWPQSTAAR